MRICNDWNQIPNLSDKNAMYPVSISFAVKGNAHSVDLESINLTDESGYVLREDSIILDYNEALIRGGVYGGIMVKNGEGKMLSLQRQLMLDKLILTPVAGFTDGETYTLTIPANSLQGCVSGSNQALSYTFTYFAPISATNTLTITEPVAVILTDSSESEPADVFSITATYADEVLPIAWSVSDGTVATITDLGQLAATGTGCIIVTATMEGTDVSATGMLYVTDDAVTVNKTVQASGSRFALFSDGTLWCATAANVQCLAADVTDFRLEDGALWVQYTDGSLTCDGVPVEEPPVSLRYTNLISRGSDTLLLGKSTLALTMNQQLRSADNTITLADSAGTQLATTISASVNRLTVIAENALVSGKTYTLTVPVGALAGGFASTNTEDIVLIFTYGDTLTFDACSLVPSADNDNPVTVLSSGAVSDNNAAASRNWSQDRFRGIWEEFLEKGYDTYFFGNVILNRLTENNVEKWLRIQAPDADIYARYGIGGNYWGTDGFSDAAKKTIINKQIIDYDDYQQYADLNEGAILESIPETIRWPVVTKVGIINSAGEDVTTIGSERVTFYVEFNRDMDTARELQVRFGSSYPFADYEVAGHWVSAHRWEGSTIITTLVGSGNQYWSIANGYSDEGWKLYKDWGRFLFKIDNAAALAMIMQAEALDNGINLTWMQDDFDTLAGYNVYRSDVEDGYYTRLNASVIPADTKEFLDENVTPGQVYYYNFTVVKTDLSESTPSGKISVRAKDTMAPSIYHDGVWNAFTGSNLVISATVRDNVAVDSVKLFYRVTGTNEWRSAAMTRSNDKYSAIVPATYLTTDGLEYYIQAFDGLNYANKGTAAAPYAVTVQQSVDKDAQGDVNGDGRINVLDALLVLQARNDLVNLTAEQFARADLDGNGELTAYEALLILQYANGMIGSLTA